MDEFLKMDIFFFVTTVVALLLGILAALILWRVYRIMTYIEELSREAGEEAVLIRADIARLRSDVKSGMRWRAFGAFVQKQTKRFFGRKNR